MVAESSFARLWYNMEQDKVNPKGKKWEFDEEVTRVFGDMLSRSIPNYDTMRELCYMVGRNFIPEKGGIVSDIGCSNGLASEKFITNYENTRFVLSDVSEPMLDACRAKYNGKTNVNVLYNDLRNGIPTQNNDLVLSSLTLQFTPIEYRWNILQSIYDSLKNNGALILVEKVLGNSLKVYLSL